MLHFEIRQSNCRLSRLKVDSMHKLKILSGESCQNWLWRVILIRPAVSHKTVWTLILVTNVFQKGLIQLKCRRRRWNCHPIILEIILWWLRWMQISSANYFNLFFFLIYRVTYYWTVVCTYDLSKTWTSFFLLLFMRIWRFIGNDPLVYKNFVSHTCV